MGESSEKRLLMTQLSGQLRPCWFERAWVWPPIVSISFTTSPIRCAARLGPPTFVLAVGLDNRLAAIFEDCSTCRPISNTEADSCSATSGPRRGHAGCWRM